MSSDRHGDRDKSRDSKSERKATGTRHHDTNQNDARSIRCRVFVGNLNTESLTRPEFQEIFSKYGRITGSSIHNGFGFVQYEKESEADDAVMKVHGTQLRGRRVDVNLAGDRRKDKDKNRGLSPEEKPVGYGRSREQSPSPSRQGSSRDRSPLSRDIRSPTHDGYRRGDDGYHRPNDGYALPDPEHYPVDDVPAKKMRPDYDVPPHPLPAPGTPIDCEVVIINKQQRVYADEVEKEIRSRGLVVECAHLPETVNLTTELEDASRRGVLYGINITSQHEVHRSVTVHILHGTQQEHRNMPLEDAINLVGRNFEMYMQALREREQAREKEQSHNMDSYETKGYSGPPAPSVSSGLYSSEVAHLLNIAADGKYLTADEYTDVINELTSIRDDILKKEGRPIPSSGSSKPFPTDPQSIALQQAELQAKILSILNPVGNKAKMTADTAPTMMPASEAKPTVSIPVLTPSYSSSPAFKSSESTITSQSSLPKTSGASQYTSNIIGMALSNLRGIASQSTKSTTASPQSSTAYTSNSSTGGYGTTSSAGYASNPSGYSATGSSYVPGMSTAAATQAWPSPQYRMPPTSMAAGSPGYGARGTPGGYPGGTLPNTYRRY